MCSVGDDNFEETENLKYMPKNEKVSLSGKCNKCRVENPIIVLRTKDKYCQKCFLAGTVHKFKALLGKHKLIRPNDRVMVIYKCGHPTTALLHFIRTGLDLDTHKKLRFEPIFLFVEEQLHLSLKLRKDLISRIEDEVAKYKFPIYFTSIIQLLTDLFSEDCLKTESKFLELTENDKTNMETYLKGQSSETNKNEYLNLRRRQLWIDSAKLLNCKFVFSPDISNDTASQILIDIALGKGSHVSLDTGFCDSRDEIKILRPLRLFDAKELAFYNHLNNLEPVTFKLHKEQTCKSVQSLMQNFVNSLQENYPATVTTVLKTGDKLSINNELTKRCDFCKAPIEQQSKELTSAESTQFSHWVSTHTLDCNLIPQDRYNQILESFENLNCDNYCFSCQKLKLLQFK